MEFEEINICTNFRNVYSNKYSFLNVCKQAYKAYNLWTNKMVNNWKPFDIGPLSNFGCGMLTKMVIKKTRVLVREKNLDLHAKSNRYR